MLIVQTLQETKSVSPPKSKQVTKIDHPIPLRSILSTISEHSRAPPLQTGYVDILFSSYFSGYKRVRLRHLLGDPPRDPANIKGSRHDLSGRIIPTQSFDSLVSEIYAARSCTKSFNCPIFLSSIHRSLNSSDARKSL